jgi:glycosyltransferase involved in cell wall biosynthesis
VLGILTTHPIQYQIPIWKGLAARGNIPFKVFYMSDQGLKARFDPGFGKSLSWDIDLLGNYDNEFLDTYRGTTSNSFWRLRLRRGFGHVLQQIGADVLWIQGWQVAAYWQAVFEARRVAAEVWLRGETNPRSNAGRIGQQFKRLLLRQLLCRVDRFLYIGNANRQFYLEQGVASGQLVAAPYCVDNARFAAAAAVVHAKRDRIRQEWAIPPEAFCFLFAGKFLNRKRPFDLIEAARRFQYLSQGRQIHLLWVGTGELGDGLRRACNVCFDAERKERVDRRRCGEPNASFVGFLNQSEISRAYVAADCLVLPSDATETWGLVVNEAMASGLPCIVSDGCGCVEDLITPIRPDLRYPVGDVAALERVMTVAISDTPPPELLKAHISKYDVSETIDAVESLYSERGSARSNRNLSHGTSRTQNAGSA